MIAGALSIIAGACWLIYEEGVPGALYLGVLFWLLAAACAIGGKR